MKSYLAPLAILVAGAFLQSPALAVATDDGAALQAARSSQPPARVMLSQVEPGMIDPSIRKASDHTVVCVASEPGSWTGYDIWNAVTCG